MKDQVAVIGVGCTNFGDLFELGYEDLICEAAFQAYADANIDPKDIQAAYPGTYNIVLVLGAEKLKDRGGRGLPRFGHPLLAKGNSAPGLFALAANRYMHTYGVGRETLAKIAVKNHRNGAKNDKAHLRAEITVEQHMKSPIIASPFGLFDCCPTTDGAAAAIVCRADLAKRWKKA